MFGKVPNLLPILTMQYCTRNSIHSWGTASFLFRDILPVLTKQDFFLVVGHCMHKANCPTWVAGSLLQKIDFWAHFLILQFFNLFFPEVLMLQAQKCIAINRILQINMSKPSSFTHIPSYLDGYPPCRGKKVYHIWKIYVSFMYSTGEAFFIHKSSIPGILMYIYKKIHR